MFVLIVHGSRNPQWRQSLEQLADGLRKNDPSREVGLAYMQFSGPSLEDVVLEGRTRGIQDFRILPLFMASAGHVDKDIRPMVDDLAQRCPDIHLQLLPPVGEQPLFHQLVLNIAQNSPRRG